MEFYNCDYRELTSVAKKDDFIFFDPPYGGTKGRYTKEIFDLNIFFKELARLNNKGVKWLLTFDGKAGNRNYIYELPLNLYCHKIIIQTGHSPFPKLMNTSIDSVSESVYLNFNLPAETFTEFTNNISKKNALFTAL